MSNYNNYVEYFDWQLNNVKKQTINCGKNAKNESRKNEEPCLQIHRRQKRIENYINTDKKRMQTNK